MDKQQAIAEAARTAIEHGGPDCLTDPRIPLAALGQALDLGATHRDIETAMKQLRCTN